MTQLLLYYYPFGIGPYFYLIIPPLLLAFYAQWKVRSAFRRYSQVGSLKGYSGAEAAESILRSNGIADVPVEEIPGQLTDHYDPRDKVLRLSGPVYQGRSLAALGVAAHEAGHALQHARGYVPMRLRSAVVPVAGLGTNGGPYLFLAGLIFNLPVLMDIGIILFAAATLFYVVTLPVEYNASSRAIQTLRNEAIILENEKEDARRVLSAAALTYLAAALMAAAQLLRLILIRNRRN